MRALDKSSTNGHGQGRKILQIMRARESARHSWQGPRERVRARESAGESAGGRSSTPDGAYFTVILRPLHRFAEMFSLIILKTSSNYRWEHKTAHERACAKPPKAHERTQARMSETIESA